MESSIAVFLMRQSACERLPTTFGASEHHYGEAIVIVLFPLLYAGAMAPGTHDGVWRRDRGRTLRS